ncbi:hypothetical protein C8R45DRAFT_334796 [Mycena sanguinolenta]|nr:hypothetical protein C8R45DRAFT_334796 [Mycena sanguinolenta]
MASHYQDDLLKLPSVHRVGIQGQKTRIAKILQHGQRPGLRCARQYSLRAVNPLFPGTQASPSHGSESNQIKNSRTDSFLFCAVLSDCVPYIHMLNSNTARGSFLLLCLPSPLSIRFEALASRFIFSSVLRVCLLFALPKVSLLICCALAMSDAGSLTYLISNIPTNTAQPATDNNNDNSTIGIICAIVGFVTLFSGLFALLRKTLKARYALKALDAEKGVGTADASPVDSAADIRIPNNVPGAVTTATTTVLVAAPPSYAVSTSGTGIQQSSTHNSASGGGGLH